MTDHRHGSEPGHGDSAGAAGHAHPTVKTYTGIALLLFAITALEVWFSVAPFLQPPDRRPLMIFLLLAAATIKFAIVVGWFMHLKFDAPVYRRLFVAPLVVTILAEGVVVWLTQIHLRA
ncbi:cytochrome C oxidase subunit IV family protein [Myxococcota bacterium]|nr:cytochrome C oxidase subunit IV family protein [Myxococcota bacterium]